MKLTNLSITIAIFMGAMMCIFGSKSQSVSSGEARSFVVRPVGWIHKQGSEPTIEIEPKYQEALLGLEGFSHLWVLWWFDRNDTPQKRAVLKVHPRGNLMNPLTGVFATRSPERPNLIGMTLCRIRSIRGSTIHIDNIDAFDNTPVLDLKPYIPRSDEATKATVPSWIVRK
jgi:tRNA-Thr(GGU) m(6)t(6)A37 methyltransferase TsaA